MTSEHFLEKFLRAGSIGSLQLGTAYSDAERLLGVADAVISDDDPVYKHAGIELYVDGGDNSIWMIQLDPFDGVLGLPVALGLGESIELPRDRGSFARYLRSLNISYRTGEYYVPQQEDLIISGSGVVVSFFADDSIASIVAIGVRPSRVVGP
jgi:hypothetical protein